jgi:DNA-binding NarL/FixJ family response regulator
MSKIRVLIADDHDIVRFGIVTVLNASERIEVVGEVANGEEALESYARLLPDVCLLDISMPKMSGIESTIAIRREHPNAVILILTMHQNEEYLNQALKAGAAGFILKQSSIKELVAAIDDVHQGRTVFSEPIAKLMADQYVRHAISGIDSISEDAIRLTRREKEITKLIVDGKTSQEIADILFISPRTVEAHRANLMQKLGLKNTAALVKFAVANGMS